MAGWSSPRPRRYGARGVGVDFDLDRVKESQANAKQAGVESLVEFRQQDALTVDVSPATVVTLYLLSESNLRLRPILTKVLQPGSRIVSHQFSMGDWAAREEGNVHRFRRLAAHPLSLAHRRPRASVTAR